MAQTLYPGLVDYVKEGLLEGTTVKDMYLVATDEYDYNNDLMAFRKYVSKVKSRHISIEEEEQADENISTEDKFINLLEKRKVVNGDELCDELNCTPGEIYNLVAEFRSQGYEIVCNAKQIILSTDIVSDVEPIKEHLEESEIIFAVMSDLHFGSKHVQITAMLEFTEECKKQGVKYIFVPGDVVAGYKVYPGQEFELYALGADEQEDSLIANLPCGFEYYMLGGNHDFSFIKKGGGHNPLLAVESRRSDIHYVGFDDADVPLMPGVDLKMWHPSGGVPYSVSYRMQKGVEQIQSHELVKIVNGVKLRPSIRFFLVGHLHIQMQAMFGSIFGAQCGAFEGQSNYLKKKGLVPAIGGYIIKATLKHNGLIKFEAPFYMYDEIINDYANYNHSVEKPAICTPEFC